MTLTLLSLTARQLLGRRRAIVIGLLALIPIVIALLYRLAGDTGAADDFTVGLVGGFVFTLLLPIGALVFGTGALGSEIEDGTIVYLLARPIARWRIVVAKAVIASLATIALTVPATLITVLIALEGLGEDSLWLAAIVPAAVGSVVYSTLFVGLSAVTGRALIIGLVYVFVWETVITNLFDGTRWVSVSQYVSGVSDALTESPHVSANLDGSQSLIASLVVIAVALAVGVRFLQRFEIGEQA